MKNKKFTPNVENMRIYDRYIHPKRCSEKTKKKEMQYLMYLEEYLSGRTLNKLRQHDIIGFQNYLDNRTHNGKPIAGSTKLGAIDRIGKFFQWLREIDEFDKVITYEITEFFKLSSKEKKVLRGEKGIKKYPTLEEVKNIIAIIPTDNLLGRRLRAILCYLFLTGARIEATATMKVGLVDLEKRIVYQYPAKKVRTKFGKRIETTLPYIDESLFQILKDYYQELLDFGFGHDDPLFPKAENEKEDGYLAYKESSSLSREFMSEKSMSKLVKEACRDAGYGQYHCHAFRDSHIYSMICKAKTPQELKAISLNVGHEKISTTIEEYADIGKEEVHNMILGMSKPSEYNLNALPNSIKEQIMHTLKIYHPDVYGKHFDVNHSGGKYYDSKSR